MSNKWTNRGDINFTTYGGCLVRPHWTEDEVKELFKSDEVPNRSLEFDVFFLNTEYGESGDELLAALCYVDIGDAWIKWLDVMTPIGQEDGVTEETTVADLLEKGWEKDALAVEVLQAHALDNFNPIYLHQDRVTLSYDELNLWLSQLGAEEFANEN